MPSSRAELTSLLSRKSPSLAGALNEPVIHFLVVARELCGDDLDMLLVMMVVVLRANLHPDFRKLDAQALANGELFELPAFDVNIQSIADSTRIPKETVRRKVARLVELGWVERQGRLLRYTPEGYRAVGPAREAFIRMAARLTEAVELGQASEARGAAT